MKYINEQGQEIQESDIDTELGYTVPDKVFVAHHDATPEVPEQFHYEVKTWYFEDGTSMDVPAGNADATVKVIDDGNGVFEYVDDGSGKVYRGAEIERVTDVEHEDAKEAEDEYENVQKYILYTEDEIADRKRAAEKAAAQESFLELGPTQLQNSISSIEDLTLMLSEVVGGAE